MNSCSGNTKNILNAILYSKKIGAKTIRLTGFKTGGKLAEVADLSLVVNSNHYGSIEDVHLMIGHLVSSCVAAIKNKESSNGKRENKALPFYID